MSLTPGEKVTLIKRSAQALSEEEWSEIDLVLRMFELPWGSDRWQEYSNGSKYDFAVEQLASAQFKDDAIVALHAYLSPDASLTPPDDEAAVGPWKADHFRLFMSHHNTVADLAGAVRQTLLRWEIDTFVAHDQIEPTQEWQDVIESALGTCDALAGLLTPDFLGSKWCDQEVGFCVGRGALIIPIRYGANPHGFIGKYQALNGTSSGWDLARKIHTLLAQHEMTTAKMDGPIIARYVNSGSYENSREAFELVRTLPAERWTAEMVRAVETAAETNSQIGNANLPGPKPIPEAMTEHLDDLLGRKVPADTSDFDVTGSADDEIPF